MTRFLVTFPLDVDLETQNPQTEAERRMRKGPGFRPMPLTIAPAEGMRLVPATDRASVLVVDNLPVGVLVWERDETEDRHGAPARRIGVRAHGVRITGPGERMRQPVHVDGSVDASSLLNLADRPAASVRDVVAWLRDGSL